MSEILVSKLKIEKIDKFQKLLFLGLKMAFFTQIFLLFGGVINDEFWMILLYILGSVVIISKFK